MANRAAEYMHWIAQTPDNFQAYGLCTRATEVALRLADNTFINTSPSFGGSWGSDVGRYMP